MRVHLPTVVGRIRADAALLLLTVLVIALTCALAAAVSPLAESTADRAVAATVREAGDRAAVVATAPRDQTDPRGQTRSPGSARELAQAAVFARSQLPPVLGRVVQPGLTSLTSTPLQLLDEGPGRYLRLAYLDGPSAGLDVTWTTGSPPAASVGEGDAQVEVPAGAPPWPVQVGVSEAAAAALGLVPGDVLPAKDEQGRTVQVVVSGVFTAVDATAPGWATQPELLQPTRGATDGLTRTAATALVSAESLPDLRLAVPADDLTERVVFVPRPERLRSADTAALGQAVVALQTSADAFSWDSLLDRVLTEARAQVDAAEGLATVLLVGVLTVAGLVLVLAAELLVRRRRGAIVQARERGATLAHVATELAVEALGVATVGALLGVGTVALLLGQVGWLWALPVLAAAIAAAPVRGAVEAARVADVRRVPAHPAARRAARRTGALRRVLVEAVVVAAAAASLVALRQRGTVVEGRTDLTATGAATWMALAGVLLLLRALPPALRLVRDWVRRSTGVVGFVTLARLTERGGQGLPLLVVTLAVAHLTCAAVLVATERDGQEAGALAAVGADARLTAPASTVLSGLAAELTGRDGVDAAAAGRVEDGVRLSARRSAAGVRLLVVDAAAYERLLAASALPDARALGRLDDDGARLPALLRGGDPELADDPQLRYRDAAAVPVVVVGTAPRTGSSTDPVLVVDAAALAARGVTVDPDTVWVVGPGAARALAAAAPAGTSEIDTLVDTLTERRDAPLPQGLVRLAAASVGLLLLLAAFGVVLGSALGAPGRGAALGRLRALGLPRPQLRRTLTGELVLPAALAVAAGLVLGLATAAVTHTSLALELVTGQDGPPRIAVPWWVVLLVAAIPLLAAALARVEASRLHHVTLARLLRGGDGRER